MSAKRTSGALMTSLVIHGVGIIIIGILLVIQTDKFKDLVGVEVYETKKPPKPHVRKPVLKPVQRPKVSPETPVAVEQVRIQPRVTSAAIARTAAIRPETVSAESIKTPNQAVKLDAPINPNVPKVVDPNAPIPPVVAKVPTSDAPDALASGSLIVTGAGGGGAGMGRHIGGMGRGTAGGTVQIKVSFERPPGLSMVDEVGAARDALSGVVEGVMLGNIEVPPLPRGEPGGRVVGVGRDIRGVFRFTRVRHSLSDWWADASALTAFAKWLNEWTKIQTDMNVEGGALKLNDANLMKSPILFMTGHDPKSGYVKSFNAASHMGVSDRVDSQLSDAEAVGLRRYLIERGGFLAFDDCGVRSPSQGMTHLFLTQMRYIMPEYQVQRLANDHEIYHNFYQMGGPPVGFSIFWWGPKPRKRNYLEGISVGDKLSVLVVRRDFMCAMEAVSLPSRRVHYSPGVYRFLTNVSIYALTHGKIADYSAYVPGDLLENQKMPTRSPEAARIGAVE